ncbi:MAG: amino acid ABC transporter substrate-binding protein [Clostridiales bacterium]|nr:amino acid ABC transporter substrate-binding protein [Clostridiales bacterium]
MKKILAIILAVMMLIPSFAMAENIVKIGVFEPASGDSGAGGKQEMLGMQYANKVQPTVTIGGVEYTVLLQYADNASSTDKAPSAASELVNAGVSVVLGSYGSGVSIAASPLFAEAGIPAIGVTCTNPQVTAGNTHYFRICFLDPFQGTVLANYAYKELGVTTAYLLGENGNDYDMGLINYFKKAYTALGGTVYEDFFPTGTADFTPYITNAQMYGAGVVFAPCSIAYDTLIINQAAGQNAEFALLGSDTWDSNMILEAATNTNLKIYVSTFYQEGGNPEFDNGFKAWLNSDAEAMTNNGGNDIISAVSAMGYDAYFVALKALEAAGSTDPKAVNDALWTVTHDGVSGAIVFDATNGDAVRDTAYIKTIDTATGSWQFVGVQGIE